MITLVNDFHNTSVNLKNKTWNKLGVYRIRQRLCGIKGCTCGGPAGERGGEYKVVEVDNGRFYQAVLRVEPEVSPPVEEPVVVVEEPTKHKQHDVMAEEKIRFKDLPIGKWFDRLNPSYETHALTLRCKKVSKWKYIDSEGEKHRIFTLEMRVFHVSDTE